MILSKEASKLMGVLGTIKTSIEGLSRTMFDNRTKVIQNLNMAVLYLNRAVDALKEDSK